MTVVTLAIARQFRATELPTEQAEAITAAIGHSISEGSATRGDLVHLKLKVFAKVDQLDAKIDTKVESLRTTLMSWLIGTGLTLAAVIIAAVKF